MGRVTFLCAICLTVVAIPAIAQTRNIVVRPKEINLVLVNPGKGIQTFQRFNGQPLNQGFKWSEAGPTSQLQGAAAPPDFPESSIAYCRWFWSAIEPEQGEFDWNIIDLALKEARQHHQRLAIRIMPYDEGDPLPEWYRNSGARRANKPTDKDGSTWQPDFSDPLYLKYWGELVANAGKRYDGNPDLDTVDVSSVGYWGEGWSPYMPAFRYQKPLIDIWLNAFKRTPLLMNFDEQQALTYGTQHGTGWRLDCWGDMRTHSDDPYFPAEMLDVYPMQIVRAGIQNAWERSPVSLESSGCPVTGKRKAGTLTIFLRRRFAGTSLRSTSSRRRYRRNGSRSSMNSRKRWATASFYAGWNIRRPSRMDPWQ
jgi:Beta-galactosidase